MKIIGEYNITSENMTSDIRFLSSCKVVINTQQEYEMLKQAMETFNQGSFGLGAYNVHDAVMRSFAQQTGSK